MPDLAVVDDDTLAARIRCGLRRARSAGFGDDAAIRLYVLLMFALEPEFDERTRLREHFGQRTGSLDDRLLRMADWSYSSLPTDFLIDLGCGDGRTVIAAAKRFGTRGLGIDLDPGQLGGAREAARAGGVAELVVTYSCSAISIFDLVRNCESSFGRAHASFRERSTWATGSRTRRSRCPARGSSVGRSKTFRIDDDTYAH